jgi:hypothetical protein
MNLESQIELGIKLGIKKANLNVLTDIEEIKKEAKAVSLEILKRKTLLVKNNPFINTKENIIESQDITLSFESSFVLASINKDIDSIDSSEELKEITGKMYEQLFALEKINSIYFK